MGKNKILVGTSSFSELDPTPRKKLENAGFEVIDNPYKRRLTKEEVLSLLKEDVIGLIAGLEPLDRDVLSLSHLKVLSRVGSGMANVDQVAAKELAISVCSTPDGPTESVAELTLACMLSILRLVPVMDAALHNGEWKKRIGFLLQNKTVLIVGYGRIGRRLAELLAPFNCRILVSDPFLSTNDEAEIEIVDLNEGLPLADIITLHASGEQCLLDKDEFMLMKQGVFLLNVARGGLISESELIKALKDESVAGAWLDTFSTEPYTGPLTEYPQVILTPHVGSYTRECRLQMEEEAVDNLLAVLLES